MPLHINVIYARIKRISASPSEHPHYLHAHFLGATPGSQIVPSMLLRARATQADLSTASLVGTTARVAGSLAASPSFLFEPFLAHSCSGTISRPPQWQDIADFRPSFLASPSACVLLKHV